MNTQHRSKKNKAKAKPKGLHPRNIHNQHYDFSALIKSYPALAPHVKTNAHTNLSIDYTNPFAVKSLNAALLKHHYNIQDWDIPEGTLCPPIPGRVDYIHYVAELLGCDVPPKNKTGHPKSNITMLDIGTGANGIYPLLACEIYGWNCVGSDINAESLQNVASIISKNPRIKDRFKLRKQEDKNHIFEGIIQTGEMFDLSVCNPPFYSSQDEALKSSQRKTNNLSRNRGERKSASPSRNFGGLEAELWCKGGERLFLKKLIKESQTFSDQCRWFTSLISKIDNVKPAKKLLSKLGAKEVKEIEMVQGNKTTRVLAWTYL